MSKFLYLVAVDGSKCSERAVERAVDLASKTQANIKLLTVIDCDLFTTYGTRRGCSTGVRSSIRRT